MPKKTKDKAVLSVDNGSFRPEKAAFSPDNVSLAQDFPAPVGLSRKAKRLWFGILENWALSDQAGLVILENLCRTQQRIDEAQRILDREGMVVTNRFGKLEQHPASMILRAEVANFAKFHKALNLEVPDDDTRAGRKPGFSPL
jgi:hypothetical protein